MIKYNASGCAFNFYTFSSKAGKNNDARAGKKESAQARCKLKKLARLMIFKIPSLIDD